MSRFGGACRQVMREFCDPETFRVILAVSEENYRVFLLKELLPVSFGPEDLGIANKKGESMYAHV